MAGWVGDKSHESIQDCSTTARDGVEWEMSESNQSWYRIRKADLIRSMKPNPKKPDSALYAELEPGHQFFRLASNGDDLRMVSATWEEFPETTDSRMPGIPLRRCSYVTSMRATDNEEWIEVQLTETALPKMPDPSTNQPPPAEPV